MKKLILIVSIILFFASNTINAQNTKTVGSGVIEFLLTTPKTANTLNETEYAALNVIGGLLRIGGQREHEMNLANAGRTEVNNTEINITDGERTARIIYDKNGNAYMIMNDVVYPISQSLVNEAKEISTTDPLTEYNTEQLEKDFTYNPTQIEHEWRVLTSEGHYYSEVQGICLADNYLFIPGVSDETGVSNRVKNGKTTVPTTAKFKCIYIPKGKINVIFLCKWHKKMGNKLSLNDFHGIRKQFKQNEKFEINVSAMVRQDYMLTHLGEFERFAKKFEEEIETKSEEELLNSKVLLNMEKLIENQSILGLEVSVFTSSGELIVDKSGTLGDADNVYSIPFSKGLPSVGKYTILIKLKKGFNIIDTKQEEFEIIADPNNIDSKTDAKANMILHRKNLQRGLYFYSNEKMEGFINLNKSIYDISKERLFISLNVEINDNNKNVIYQSFTLDGKLLGTTTHPVEGTFFTGSDSNPTENFDFIDVVKNNGPGKYKIKATVEATGEEFIRWVEIK